MLVVALILGFGQKELMAITAAAAGGLIAFYQIGYGIAAFGVGPLQTWAGLDLNIIYGGTAVVALAMAALSFGVTPAQMRYQIPCETSKPPPKALINWTLAVNCCI